MTETKPVILSQETKPRTLQVPRSNIVGAIENKFLRYKYFKLIMWQAKFCVQILV